MKKYQISNIKNKIYISSIKYKYKKIFHILYVFLIFYILSLISLVNTTSAQVYYPIPELGGCSSSRECEFYCEIPKNTPACWSYDKYVMNASESVLGEETGPELTYPIAELGKCASAAACFTFCAKPANQLACYNFAKNHGLVKEETTDSNVQQAIEAAKTELGCNSKEACRSLCNQPENFDKCRTFAQKYSLLKSQSQNREPLSEEILTAAQTELGCNSRETCADVCHQKENRKKCKEFAGKYNLGSPPKPQMPQEMMQQLQGSSSAASKPTSFVKGPGDCTSEEECRKYCEKHPNECPGFLSKPPLTPPLTPAAQNTTSKGQFLGPTGCKTEAECKAYCTKHPKECPGFPKTLPNTTTSPLTKITPMQNQPTLPPEFKIPPTLAPAVAQ